jgi:hypothetical protein
MGLSESFDAVSCLLGEEGDKAVLEGSVGFLLGDVTGLDVSELLEELE